MAEQSRGTKGADASADVARAVYATVMAAGHAGTAAGDLRALHPGFVGDPVEFVKQHAGLTIRRMAQTGGDERYFVEPTAAASD
jgi:hypothetical protein